MGEDDTSAEGHRAGWGQEGAEVTEAPPSRKRPAPVEDEEDLPDDVQRRLDALKGGA